MSGGHFDYVQHRLHDVADQIRLLIECNNVPDEYDYCRNYSEQTINAFILGLKKVEEAEVFIQRIDWLVCGDDGEDDFMSRLMEELAVINRDNSNE